ncbi:MAG: DUF3794 domain-containing protein [Ruminococcus sp.]|nr:DUF3794 domain-containing protein [Ruminococcus sp.]
MDTMDFKVNKEIFTASTVVLDTSCEQSVERDFVLPDYCPDIFRVLKCRVIPKILSQSINGEKITFELAVLIRVLYQSEGSGKLNCLEQKATYSKSVEISGECSNPMVSITPHTDYVNCRVVNQRRLDVRGAVTSRVRVTAEKKQPVIVDAFGGNIQLKKTLVTYPAKRLVSSKRVTVIEELELGAAKPQIDAVIRSDCTVFPHEQKIIAGKLVTKGDAEISMLYTCTNGEEERAEPMKFTIPFSQIIDIEGIDESYEAFVDIIPASCEIMPKGEADSLLECELVLIVNCTALKFETKEAVCDAYSTCYECELENVGCRVDSKPVLIGDTHELTAQVKYEDEGIKCIYDAWCEADNLSVRFDDEKGKYVASCNVNFTVVGKNENDSPVYLETEAAFDHDIDLPDDYSDDNSYIDAKTRVKSCSYHLLDENTAEVKAEIEICGYLYDACAKTMLSNLRTLPDKPKEKQENYALKLCYCNGEEDIWEIAKKYSTSVSAILDENDLADDKPLDYGMLLIPLTN